MGNLPFGLLDRSSPSTIVDLETELPYKVLNLNGSSWVDTVFLFPIHIKFYTMLVYLIILFYITPYNPVPVN